MTLDDGLRSGQPGQLPTGFGHTRPIAGWHSAVPCRGRCADAAAAGFPARNHPCRRLRTATAHPSREHAQSRSRRIAERCRRHRPAAPACRLATCLHRYSQPWPWTPHRRASRELSGTARGEELHDGPHLDARPTLGAGVVFARADSRAPESNSSRRRGAGPGKGAVPWWHGLETMGLGTGLRATVRRCDLHWRSRGCKNASITQCVMPHGRTSAVPPPGDIPRPWP